MASRLAASCCTPNAALKKLKKDKKEIKLPEDFEVGYFRVKEITGHNLKNTEFMGKQVRFLSFLIVEPIFKFPRA